MKIIINRSHSHQIIRLVALLILVKASTSEELKIPEILVKRYTPANSTNVIVPKILKLTPNGHEEIIRVSDAAEQPLFTMKSDPVKVQSNFKTVDITVLNKEREEENAKIVAKVQEDLQSRLKITGPESTSKEISEETKEPEIVDPEELRKKQAKVKEDIESRVLLDDDFLGFKLDNARKEKHHYPVKRSDEDYYGDDSERLQPRTTTEVPKEEDSFFSIFESLFGSSDEDSESKKKAKPEEPKFKEPEDIKENIRTVGDILKPLKTIDEPESRISVFANEEPEYRIVNNYHSSQVHKQSFKSPEPKPGYQSFYRPTEKPFRPYQPTNGYDDYDLEEFMDKTSPTTTKIKYVSPILSTSTRKNTVMATTSTTTSTTSTTTTAKSSTKSNYDNKLKFPSVEKKNNYINRYQESTEKITEKITHEKPEIKTTTEVHRYSKPTYQTNLNEVKAQKIQESPNFYNLINLPVKYSTKDTAIPLISGSYANTKIQGMGAHKYEKGANGKYPNHKYDQVTPSTTKKPNYWATQRTSTTSSRPSPLIPKTTTKHTIADLDNLSIGMGPEYGGYGNKKEVKTETPYKQSSTTFHKETTTRKNDALTSPAQETRPNVQQSVKIAQTVPVSEKTSSTQSKDVYEEYEYENENYPAVEEEFKPNVSQMYPAQGGYINNIQKNEANYSVFYTKSTVPPKTQETEYEYYDYEDFSTTTTKLMTFSTATTPKYKVKYPSLSKDKIKASSSEKVAVVIPSKDHEFYEGLDTTTTEKSSSPTTTLTATTTTTMTTTTTTTSTTPRPLPTTTKATTLPITTSFYKPSMVFKEPAPVFEDVKEDEESITSTRKVMTERPISDTTPVLTSSSKEQESNLNIVLVPTKETNKADEKYSRPERPPSAVQNLKKPGNFQSKYDLTTEFTIGAVQGGSQNRPIHQNGHFVATSISANPYGNDEPFRPIPKPVGMTASFQVVHEDTQRLPSKKPIVFQNKRPLPSPPALEEQEPVHEPHEFIPSPQFHRPSEPKPVTQQRPDVDYDFDGIQTEPKPGQFVIFSKPQLNPEMNENQLKKNTEINVPSKAASNNLPLHEKVNNFGQESQNHVVFKEGHAHHKPLGFDKTDQLRPVFGGPVELTDDRLSLELMPPRGTQTEKPFEGNFVLPEKEKQVTTITYPRPHWEKNGKPTFLVNKAEAQGNRLPPLPPQMAHTLLPPSSISPQRFRRPIQQHIPPMRKNFNEAGTNAKPKPNLPNILPQFRPNTKVGGGPYHRPHISSNRRNGMNRYHEKEQGNFPYHIQHPDKDTLMLREYDTPPEIIPKFITNRGKLPSELWNGQGMQKRFGQGPLNINTRPDEHREKILRRFQRTPVTTLQMLKQIPGIKTQVNREGGEQPSAPLVPPIYQTFVDQPKNDENVYIVYPAKAPQRLQPDNSKVFVVSDTKNSKNQYNQTKIEHYPLFNLSKKNENQKNNFPYGFFKEEDKENLIKKQNEEKNIRAEDFTERKYLLPEKNEKIDMNLHMQSNNQWNEIRATPDSTLSGKTDSQYRYSQQSNKNIQVNPPSEYHTSIQEGKDSAFTLGAVMHTVSEENRKGQVASVSFRDEKQETNLPKLNVNEKISNGKIITVSMPLDVKRDEKEEEDSKHYSQFQAPFQASSSVISSETNHGWSIVPSPEDKSNGKEEQEKEDSESTTTPKFNFENFKPELIGGFKPIYELPEEPKPEEEKEVQRPEAVARR